MKHTFFESFFSFDSAIPSISMRRFAAPTVPVTKSATQKRSPASGMVSQAFEIQAAAIPKPIRKPYKSYKTPTPNPHRF